VPRPAPQVNFISTGKHPEKIIEDVKKMVDQVNAGFRRLNDRIESDSTYETGEPPIPESFAVEGRNGGYITTWKPVDPTTADGYLLVVAKDQNITQITQRIEIPDVRDNSEFVFVGDSAVTRYFQLHSKNGKVYSQPTVALSATSTASSSSTSGSQSPSNTTFDNTETTLATVTFTATGRTVQATGTLVMRSQAVTTDTVTLRLVEDSTTFSTRIVTVPASGSDKQDFTIVGLRTSAAGSHDYKLTAQNADSDTIDAESIVLVVVEQASSASEADPDDPPEWAGPVTPGPVRTF
jgi:hypothetical protein